MVEARIDCPQNISSISKSVGMGWWSGLHGKRGMVGDAPSGGTDHDFASGNSDESPNDSPGDFGSDEGGPYL